MNEFLPFPEHTWSNRNPQLVPLSHSIIANAEQHCFMAMKMSRRPGSTFLNSHLPWGAGMSYAVN
jgi:hypothetical protein